MLSEFIASNRDEIIRRCRTKVATRSIDAPAAAEFDHGVPLFLDQLVDAIGKRQSSSVDINETALLHGRDLLQQGLTMSQVVHDYGDVCQSVTELASETGAPISAEDFGLLNGCLDNAIAGAVTQYGRDHHQAAIDGETLRESERLGFFTHELKNLLHTAMLAFEIVKSGNVGVGGSTGAVLQRSLLGASDLVARTLAETRPAQSIPNPEPTLQSAIFNSANFSSIATDANGVIQIFNVGAERMLGYTAAEVTNKITPADISDPQEMIARAEALSIQLGTPITPGFEALVFKASRGIEDIYELTYIRKDGSRFPAVVSVTALRDAADTIIGYLLIGTDNTARKRIEVERMKEQKLFELTLQQKNAELEAASRLKSEFLANMSHELRTPLNAIMGFSEVLRDGIVGKLTDQQRMLAVKIFTSGQHLLSLINDILDLSKVEAGKMTLDLETVPIASLLGNSLTIIKEKAASRRIRVGMEADKALGSTELDPRKVKQIVYNLLSNAVKFSNEGGQVTLSARRATRDEVGRVSGDRASRVFPPADSDFQEFLEVSVTDDGLGISSENLAQLFVPFTQIDSGLARKFEGTGLGLAMVKLLVQLHGGAVAVETAIGEGSRFTVWLPFRYALAAPARLDTASVRRGLGQASAGTALMVEDDVKSAELVRLQLEGEGFTVLHATSAEEALAMAGEQPLALITLDIMLPDMDGWDFLARIKQISALMHIPVVIISIVADRNKGFALGASAIMQKPMSRQDLADSLVELGLLPLVHGRALKVLVVDDDADAVELVAIRVQGLAGTVVRAYGGAEGLAAAREHAPDVIVLDLMMPEVSGFDVVKALSDQPKTARIPILIVTAKQITPDDRANLNGYVTTIMEKTEFSRQRFIAEVRRAMSGRRVGI
jgi:signal transduction histidine kinase/CheY-like chemotaxis protein